MRGVVYHNGPCPYLPDREFHAFHPLPNPPEEPSYRTLMDWRFRRSGGHLYMPMCPSCDACKPLRVDIPAFEPRQDQRRCANKNSDLAVSWQARGLDDERLALYQAYQLQIHGKPSSSDPSSFLVEDGGVTGGELHARDGKGRLLAVSVCDQVGDALSSVYCYYLPSEARRALGTFMGLSEIQYGRSQGLRWLYLGFLVQGCRKMEYKARFRPHEVLEDGIWVRHA
jgi:arginyl-tRNA--protein-N-Asp/Glu arginylyltransferase